LRLGIGDMAMGICVCVCVCEADESESRETSGCGRGRAVDCLPDAGGWGLLLCVWIARIGRNSG
jgi:hypothetical protein